MNINPAPNPKPQIPISPIICELVAPRLARLRDLSPNGMIEFIQ
jgi:hypothetical protein